MESIEYLDDLIESYKCNEYYKKLASVIKSEILYELGMKEKAEELLNEISVNHNEFLLNELLNSMLERVNR